MELHLLECSKAQQVQARTRTPHGSQDDATQVDRLVLRWPKTEHMLVLIHLECRGHASQTVACDDND